MTRRSKTRWVKRLLLAQGAYYAATGLWSLVDVDSFQRVTGPKTDVWLVKTVGVLVTAIGAALALGSVARRPAPETKMLAVASAIGLTAIEVYYSARRVISPIYLADAALEAALISGVAAVGRGAAR